MVVDWESYAQELRNKGITPDEILIDIHKLIDVENKEKGDTHSLVDRIHIFQNATMQLAFGEGICEELMDWSAEMLELLEEESETALHFVLELEASEKMGKKWIAKHHNKIISGVEIEKKSKTHFLGKVRKMLNRLIKEYKELRENLDHTDKERIDPLIAAVTHKLNVVIEDFTK